MQVIICHILHTLCPKDNRTNQQIILYGTAM